MLYRIETNIHSNLFNYHLTSDGLPEDKQRLVETLFYSSRNSSELLPEENLNTNVQVFQFNKIVEAQKVNAPRRLIARRNKEPNMKRYPDFWTSISVATVTHRFKEYIDEIDPGVHQFIPFDVYHWKTGKLYEEPRFYRFVCGRFIKLPFHRETLDKTTCDIERARPGNASGVGNEFRYLRSVVDRVDIQEALESFPLWQLFEGGHECLHFANRDFIEGTQKRKLIGFKETSKDKSGFDIYRDVSHIWY